MARPRKPVEKKLQSGTVNVTRDRGRLVPVEYVDELSSPPDFLGREGKKFYKEVYNICYRWGVLAVTDLTMLGIVSEDFQKMKTFYKRASKCKKLNDELRFEKLALDYRNRVTRGLARFGFSPEDRGKVSLLRQPKDRAADKVKLNK